MNKRKANDNWRAKIGVLQK